MTDLPMHLRVLDDAARMLDEDRQDDYGDPEENFTRIAALWSAYLNMNISPDQVAVMMTLMKCSRLAHSPDHYDSFVDGVAYLAMASRLVDGLSGGVRM